MMVCQLVSEGVPKVAPGKTVEGGQRPGLVGPNAAEAGDRPRTQWAPSVLCFFHRRPHPQRLPHPPILSASKRCLQRALIISGDSGGGRF